MARVISTLFSILLLVVADRTAVHLKKLGVLPAAARTEAGSAGSNETRIAAGPERHASTRDVTQSN
jgi:hypothetical protein